jgi:hypothetical protein
MINLIELIEALNEEPKRGEFSYLCAFYFAMCCLAVVVLLPIAVLLLAGYACGHLAGVW